MTVLGPAGAIDTGGEMSYSSAKGRKDRPQAGKQGRGKRSVLFLSAQTFRLSYLHEGREVDSKIFLNLASVLRQSIKNKKRRFRTRADSFQKKELSGKKSEGYSCEKE
jgi:hypothetical protein